MECGVWALGLGTGYWVPWLVWLLYGRGELVMRKGDSQEGAAPAGTLQEAGDGVIAKPLKPRDKWLFRVPVVP